MTETGRELLEHTELPAPSNELRKRNLEHEINFNMDEAVSLFRAEYVLLNSMTDTTLPEDMRAKREPFLKLSNKLVRAELEKRLKEIHERLGEWQKM